MKYLLLILLFAGCGTRQNRIEYEIGVNNLKDQIYFESLMANRQFLALAECQNDSLGIKVYKMQVDSYLKYIIANNRETDSLKKLLK